MFLALEGFWLIIVSIIAFIIILGLIIVLHEFGHFIVARLSGITCHEFSIGMGPALYKKELKGGTTFALRAIPIGGYVSMANEEVSQNSIKEGMEVSLVLDDDKISRIILDPNIPGDVRGKIIEKDMYNEEGTGMYLTLENEDGLVDTYELAPKCVYVFDNKNTVEVTPYNECFESKPLWKRFLTLLAGPLMNFILAIVLYLIYFCVVGVPNLNSTTIGNVINGYSGSHYLQDNDVIVEINGVPVSSWNDVTRELNKDRELFNTSTVIKVNRDGVIKEEKIDYSIIINSIGLTNLETDSYTRPEGITGGVIVGNIGLNYADIDDKNGKYVLKPGDIILKMRVDEYVSKDNYKPGVVMAVNSWQDIVNNLKDADVTQVHFEYYSQARVKDKKDPIVKIDESAPISTWGNEMLNNQRVNKIDFKLGINPIYHFDFGGILGATFSKFWSDFTLIFRTLQLLIAPSGIRQVGLESMSSVVGIFGMVENMVRNGILPLIAFAAMLSINIGIINLLPIPALDGGRIVFLGYELVTRRKPNPKFEAVLNNVFFILLLILLIYVTYNDIRRLKFIVDIVARL